MITIIPEKTAIVNGVAKSATVLAKETPLGTHILDYGAGKLRNTKYLIKEGFKVSILETPRQLEVINNCSPYNIYRMYQSKEEISERFGAILCSFVLNVVPIPKDRDFILAQCYELLIHSGKLYVEVRKSRGILNNKYKWTFGDGFIIGKNKEKTFQKPYEKIEFCEYISSHGFEVERIESSSDGWLIVAKKI